MDEQRARIQDDLRGLLAGDVRADDVFLQLYATDASLYQIRPLAVVMPRSADDVIAAVKYAAAQQIPLHARGAGTGLAGESLGPGLVLDFSKHMRKIIRVEEDSVRVQPGVVLERLNSQLQRDGRLFGPDPATIQTTTMGSVVAIDAAGSHWLRYGSARRHVRSLQVVLADGTLLELGNEPLPAVVDPAFPQKHALIEQLRLLLWRESELIHARQPDSRLNRSGYALAEALQPDSIDVAKLLTGSEGTLALITEMTLATVPRPRYRGVALLFFDRLESASRAVLEILPFQPSACDLMDRRHLSLARENEPRFDRLIPTDAEALLLVEQQGDDAAQVRDNLRRVVDHVRTSKHLAFEARQALDMAEVDLFWRLAQQVTPTLHRMRGSIRAVPFIEDIAVPPESLPTFLIDMQNVLKRHHVTAALFGHAGHGQLHVRPFLDLQEADGVLRMQRLAGDLYELVFSVGGTISGEHGDGLSRTPFVQRQFGPLYDVFKQVKQIFDPHNLLNPGKVIGDDPDLMTKNLRPPITSPALSPPEGETVDPQRPAYELQLHWPGTLLEDTVASCNGCGACRSQAPNLRMCPIFRAAPAEAASPRAKANLMRGLLTGDLAADAATGDDFKEIADLCVHCHQCHSECPAGVDIPRLMLEAKAAHVASHGLNFSEWVLAHVDLVSRIGSALAPLANPLLNSRRARWLGEKLFGVAQGRKLPRFAGRSFMYRARRRKLTRPTRRSGPKVLYFVDTFANYHDPQLGDALVAVLEHNAVAVYVHPEQRASGMPLIAVGAVEAARKIARHNVRLLADAIRQGYHIIATEPSAALCLACEYANLLDDEDALLVAQNSSEACAYLWRMHRSGKLALDFSPLSMTLGYHLPCHEKALQVGNPGENLLRLIPGLRVASLDKGCSGMAGVYGLQRANYRTSLRAGLDLMNSLRQGGLQAGSTECSACKLQMEQAVDKPTMHPLKIMAYAYGLMPQLSGVLAQRGR
ncbi:MAG: anaerobic glycerol-3-phosphate dehydrogenase subunit C [Pirellulales bacterium]|nr:anaerobic glycerol-3-phosphate dehydrogenase subunit C [Pirellulales bacterium]